MQMSILKDSTKRYMFALILNAVIVVMEIIGLGLSISEHGFALFQFYTEDSNLLIMVASLLYVIYAFKNRNNNHGEVPRWISDFKYVSTACLMVTFVVVLTILAPMFGSYEMMLFEGSMLYHHFICPIVALVSFLFLETGPELNKKNIGMAMLPTLLYAAVVLTLNIAKVMTGPYPFLHVYEQPVYMSIVWVILIIGGACLLAWLLLLIHKKINN